MHTHEVRWHGGTTQVVQQHLLSDQQLRLVTGVDFHEDLPTIVSERLIDRRLHVT